MASENFVKYILGYQGDDLAQNVNKKNKETQEKLHFGFIYSKIVNKNYVPVSGNAR